MNLLDSSLEALAFSYFSYGFVAAINTLWPWITVVTAALGFWRIRAAGSSCSVESPRIVPLDTSSAGDHVELANDAPAPSQAPETSASISAEDNCKYNWVTKGRRFTVKFEDDEGRGDGGDAVETEPMDGCEAGNGEWWNWAELLRTRRGEMGWYGYQDLTAINGNVVRLWDYRPTCCASVGVRGSSLEVSMLGQSGTKYF